jgi:MraZ protein
MLLTGTFRRSIDEKLRFAIPKSLRDAFEFPQNSVLYLAPGTDETLALYPEQSFSRLAEKLEQGPPNAKEVRAFSRLFFAQVQRVEVDKLGRVRLPVESAQLVSVRKEIILLGVHDHMEVWDTERWDAYLSRTQPHYDELADQAFSGSPAATTPAASDNDQRGKRPVSSRPPTD